MNLANKEFLEELYKVKKCIDKREWSDAIDLLAKLTTLCHEQFKMDERVENLIQRLLQKSEKNSNAEDSVNPD